MQMGVPNSAAYAWLSELNPKAASARSRWPGEAQTGHSASGGLSPLL